ncbi:MAG: metabolite traffic protein EboE [Planctomycetota bacterium]
MSIEFGYCTNVHPGISLEQVRGQLLQHAVDVHRIRGGQAPLWLGLWFGESASRELSKPGELPRFREFLSEHGFQVRTLNGFPAGDFHQPIVKHAVYQPTWAEPSRLEYTCRLIDLLIGLLGDRKQGTISTLPLGWPSGTSQGHAFHDACSDNLLAAARYAEQRAAETGKRIRICLEPEPGCTLSSSSDVVEYFTDYLFSIEPDLTAAHLGICHDVCHAVVMKESQQEALSAYRANEIPIGKVQISAALLADFSGSVDTRPDDLARQLAEFAEPRYLHQTMAGGRLYEDLPDALAAAEKAGQWRVHFHLPIFVEALAPGLSSSQQEIVTCWNYLKNYRGVGGGPDSLQKIDWEIETYAWGVLPQAWRPATLASGIAAELEWFERLVSG